MMVKAVPAPPRRFLLSDSTRLPPKKPLQHNTCCVQLCKPCRSTATGSNDTDHVCHHNDQKVLLSVCMMSDAKLIRLVQTGQTVAMIEPKPCYLAVCYTP